MAEAVNDATDEELEAFLEKQESRYFSGWVTHAEAHAQLYVASPQDSKANWPDDLTWSPSPETKVELHVPLGWVPPVVQVMTSIKEAYGDTCSYLLMLIKNPVLCGF